MNMLSLFSFFLLLFYSIFELFTFIKIFNVPGLGVGALLRFSGDSLELTHETVVPADGENYTDALPPDRLWLKFSRSNYYWLFSR